MLFFMHYHHRHHYELIRYPNIKRRNSKGTIYQKYIRIGMKHVLKELIHQMTDQAIFIHIEGPRFSLNFYLLFRYVYGSVNLKLTNRHITLKRYLKVNPFIVKNGGNQSSIQTTIHNKWNQIQ